VNAKSSPARSDRTTRDHAPPGNTRRRATREVVEPLDGPQRRETGSDGFRVRAPPQRRRDGAIPAAGTASNRTAAAPTTSRTTPHTPHSTAGPKAATPHTPGNGCPPGTNRPTPPHIEHIRRSRPRFSPIGPHPARRNESRTNSLTASWRLECCQKNGGVSRWRAARCRRARRRRRRLVRFARARRCRSGRCCVDATPSAPAATLGFF
jgi:hypothetical protein